MKEKCDMKYHQVRFENETDMTLCFSEPEMDTERNMWVIRLRNGKDYSGRDMVVGYCEKVEYTFEHKDSKVPKYKGMCKDKESAKEYKQDLPT